ncbi:MAG: NAD(P)H-hydrate dehydratase, partial [Polaromonas sp.]
PCAWLLGLDQAGQPAKMRAPHASHKGSFGDVAVIGGQSSAAATVHMTGAALLAARAALHAGAGRVFVALLGADGPRVDTLQPELMFRTPEALDLNNQVVVCGCGGGEAVKSVIARVLSSATRAVLDADALNAIATNPKLQTLLAARHGRGYRTVLTPHPLEAARLAGSTAGAVQADRLGTAAELAQRFQCVVVLKGSGSIIAAPGQTSRVNASGNALLATAGTGDVLAGMTGAYMSRGPGDFEAACSAVFAHGRRADTWTAHNPHRSLTAAELATWQAG